MLPNTPLHRGSDCTALVRRPRDRRAVREPSPLLHACLDDSLGLAFLPPQTRAEIERYAEACAMLSIASMFFGVSPFELARAVLEVDAER